MKVINLYVFKQALSYKSGALLIIVLPLSIGFPELLTMLMKDVDVKDIVIPVLSLVVGFLLYLIFFISDFWTGMVASRYEFKTAVKSGTKKNTDDWVQSSKLFRTMWKMLGVMLIHLMFLIITVLLVLLGFAGTSMLFLIIGLMLSFLASSYEFHSIGENIKRRSPDKTKPDYFRFFDKITAIIETKILGKVENI